VPEIELTTDVERMDFDLVHAWLTNTYWSPGIERAKVEKAARLSALVIGAFDGPVQVGYTRIISDKTTFAWVCDVYVEESVRGHGIARAMLRLALEHPEFQGLRRWALATKDAHAVYAGCGFEALPEPDRWMIRLQKPYIP